MGKEELEMKVACVLDYAKRQPDYVYDPENKTINGKKVTEKKLYQVCLLKCGNRMRGTDNSIYQVWIDERKNGLNENVFELVLHSVLPTKESSNTAEVELSHIINLLGEGTIKDKYGILSEIERLQLYSKTSSDLVKATVKAFAEVTPIEESNKAVNTMTGMEDAPISDDSNAISKLEVEVLSLLHQLPESIKQSGDMPLILDTMKSLL